MSDFSDYYENKVIDHMMRGVAFTQPATIYVALFSASTGLEANNPSAEIAGTGYARQAITLAAASGGTATHVADVTFPVAGTNWLEATHFAIVDHATNVTWGSNVNVLMWKVLPTPRTALTGDQLKFLAGQLTVTVA